MMRAENRALHEAETTLGRVGMRKTTKLREFICRMVHGAVVGKLLSYFFIGRQFVCHKMRFAANCRDDLFAKRFGFDIGDMKRTAFAITLDKSKHGMFFRFLLGIGAIFRLAAEKTFVCLDNFAFAADR